MARISFTNKGLLLALILSCLNIAACTKSPLQVEYHYLSVEAKQSSIKTAAPSPLLIGPVQTSVFLNQGPIVKQHSSHSADLLEQHQWAGNLDEMLSQVLTQNLINTLGSEEVYPYPENSSNSGIRLSVNFFHFEENSDGKAYLEARWKIISNKDQTILYSSSSKQSRILAGSDSDALAKALSFCVTELSGEIVQAIKQLPSSQEIQ